ncbi:peptidoglycan editing factor PgeF [Patescibacteria group bacterium]|nr:peptidoglycan editing factor PgeF [Patescibacteria group bacterium]
MNFTDNHNLDLGISDKKDGPMKSSLDNRLLFFKNKNLDHKIIVSAGLVHKNRVVVVDGIDKSKSIPDCDALITNQNKYLLTITIADCLPIYFYDKSKKIIALAHAGWRGVVSNIAWEVINVFISHYNSKPNDIEVFIGPHIKDCHFEVKDDVASQFKTSDSIIINQKIYINLAKIVREQLFELGLRDDNIKITEECTYCLSDKYFSYRRDKPEELETMIAYIGLK